MSKNADGSPRILFVCLGNICRSPMAEGIFRAMAEASGAPAMTIDSAGTSDFHEGNPPDRRAQGILRAKGIDISRLRARQVTKDDFAAFDYILAMDETNFSDLKKLAPDNYAGVLKLFLDYAPTASAREVPDPYFGKDDGFDHVYQLIAQASEGLLGEIQRKASKPPLINS